jgi:hypothetical protein
MIAPTAAVDKRLHGICLITGVLYRKHINKHAWKQEFNFKWHMVGRIGYQARDQNTLFPIMVM